jgi:hypothetical protein
MYEELLGSIYITKKQMKIFGVWARSEEPKIDYYSIAALPGIGGREIQQLGYLPAGTMLRITKIVRETPSITLYNNGIVFLAEIISKGAHYMLEVEINSNSDTYIKSNIPGKYILSNEYFIQLDTKL